MQHLTIEQQIRSEIYGAFEHLGAERELLELLGTIGSWGNTLDDEEVLGLLKEWLRGAGGYELAILVWNGAMYSP